LNRIAILERCPWIYFRAFLCYICDGY